MDATATPSLKTIPFPKGSLLFLFTDGLLESENPQGRQFGKKRVRKILEKQDTSPRQVIAEIETQWTKYRDGVKAEDDICMISMRAA